MSDFIVSAHGIKASLRKIQIILQKSSDSTQVNGRSFTTIHFIRNCLKFSLLYS